MKRLTSRRGALRTLATAGAAGLAAPHIASAQGNTTTWRIQTSWPGGAGLQVFKDWCASIQEKSGGELAFQPFGANDVVGDFQLYDAVKNGASGYLLKDSSIDEVAQAIRVVADGQSLISPSMAIKLLDEFKQMSRTDRSTVPTPRLTERELEVLRLVAQGLSNREISARLFLSVITIKGHNRNIFRKLGVRRRTEAVARARELGLF